MPCFSSASSRLTPDGDENGTLDHRPKNIRSQQRRRPRHRGTPVVADDNGLRLAQRVDQFRHVADVVQHGVRRHVRGRVGAAVAAHVGRHRPVASAGQSGQLVSPGTPRFRKTMAQQHKRPTPLHGHPHVDAIERQGLEGYFVHLIAARSVGSLAAAALALALLSLIRANLAESSAFTPRIIAVTLFRRHCDSHVCTPGC